MKISDRHLTPEELVDIVEGTRDEASAPHLTICLGCRGRLTGLRDAMSTASDVDVPEPSPLFWSQMSRRIGDAVRSEQISRPWWLEWTRPRVLVPVAAVAVAALILAVVPNRQMNPDSPVVRQSVPVASVAAPAGDRASDPTQGDALDSGGDDSLTLVADLTANLDLNGAADAGLTSRGSAEHAVAHMSADELRALERVLKEELARSGA